MKPHTTVGPSEQTLARVLYWAPRVLSLLFAGFISLFALDVFGVGYGFWETLLALTIHLIPTALILLIAALAWRWEWLGALAYLGMAAWYILLTGGEEHWTAYLVIVGSLLLLAVLYLLSWRWRLAHSASGATGA